MSDLFYKAAVLIQNAGNFDDWEYKGVGRVEGIEGLGLVKLVEVDRPDDPEDSYYQRYGEYPSGYEGRIALVFEVEVDGETVFVRKSGTKDSYGSESWDGPIEQVQKTTKTVVAYERV
jgi:hypothetical protein